MSTSNWYCLADFDDHLVLTYYIEKSLSCKHSLLCVGQS